MTSRERRALRWGAGVLLAVLLTVRVMPAGLGWFRELRARTTSGAELLARERAQVTSLARLEDSSRIAAAQLVALAPRILNGGSEGEAASDLASRVGQGAEAARVKLLRTDPVVDSGAAGLLRRMALRAELEGDTRGIVRLVAGLEGSAVVLRADRLRVSAPDPLSPVTRPEVLHAELTVHGWYLARGEP